MKNANNRIAIVALAIGSMFSNIAWAQTKPLAQIDDVAVGQVISGGVDGGIKLHGFLDSAPLPLPVGDWKVKKISTVTEDFRTVQQAFVKMDLSTGKYQPDLPSYMILSFNPRTYNTSFGLDKKCNNNGTAPLKNGFETAASMLTKICAVAEVVESKNPIQSSIVLQITAFKAGGRLTFWNLVFNRNVPYAEAVQTFKSGDPYYEAVAKYAQQFGDGLRDFLHNNPVSLPERLELADVAPAAKSDVTK